MRDSQSQGECCVLCRYFIEAGSSELADKGFCRRYPPAPQDDWALMAHYPVVKTSWWCGEWTRRRT